MKKKHLVILTLAMITLIASILGYNNISGETTPLEFAKKQSGLELPKDLELETYKDEWQDFNGDGYRKIVFELKEKDFQELEKECVENNYSKLPVVENGYMPFYLNKADTGYYKLEFISSDKNDFMLTVVNFSQSKLFLEVSAQ